LDAGDNRQGLGYVARGHYVTASGRTREEARISLLKKLEKLGLPAPDRKIFEQPSGSSGSTSPTELRNQGAGEKFRCDENS
jgi:hypothetical protein